MRAENAQHPEAAALAAGCKHFPGLLAGEGAPGGSAMAELDRCYDAVYSGVSEMDERPFIDGRPGGGGRGALLGGPGGAAAALPSLTKCQVGTPVRSRRYAAADAPRTLPLLPVHWRPPLSCGSNAAQCKRKPALHCRTAGVIPFEQVRDSAERRGPRGCRCKRVVERVSG